MAEEANNDVKTSVDAETTTTESSAEKINTSTDSPEEDELVFNLDEPDGSAEEKPAEESDKKDSEEAESEEEASETQKSEGKSTRAEERKQQLNNEIRNKVAERNALRKEIAELNRQKYQIKNESDLPTVESLREQINPETNDYYTRTEAKLARIEAERELERQQKQIDEYTNAIVDNQIQIADEANRVLKDFPMFDENSPSYNANLAKQAEEIANGLIRKDPQTGQIIGTSGSIYNVYAAIANARNAGETSGKISGRKAASDMMNNTDAGSFSKAPESKDEFGDAFLSGLLG